MKVPLDEAMALSPSASDQVQDLDDALTRLAQVDERKAKLVEMLYFGGLSYVEMAEVAGISESTVHRELRLAKAWIRHEIE